MNSEPGPQLCEADVERYLLENTAFLENWLKKHGTAELLDKVKTMDVLEKPKFNTAPRNSITSNMFKVGVGSNSVCLRYDFMIHVHYTCTFVIDIFSHI